MWARTRSCTRCSTAKVPVRSAGPSAMASKGVVRKYCAQQRVPASTSTDSSRPRQLSQSTPPPAAENGMRAPSTSATGSPQPTQTSRLGRRPEKARIFNSSAAESAARWLSSAPSMASSTRIADWNRRGLARSRWLMRASSSATGAAAAEASRLQRKASWAATSRASFRMSRLRPVAHRASMTQKGSVRAAKLLLGRRAPLATARFWLPSSESSVRMRSLSPSFVRRSTRARRE